MYFRLPEAGGRYGNPLPIRCPSSVWGRCAQDAGKHTDTLPHPKFWEGERKFVFFCVSSLPFTAWKCSMAWKRTLAALWLFAKQIYKFLHCKKLFFSSNPCSSAMFNAFQLIRIIEWNTTWVKPHKNGTFMEVFSWQSDSRAENTHTSFRCIYICVCGRSLMSMPRSRKQTLGIWQSFWLFYKMKNVTSIMHGLVIRSDI